MFVLTDDKSGGVYAVRDDEKMERVVQLFVDKDDAERYYIMLKADEYPRDLSITEVDEETEREIATGARVPDDNTPIARHVTAHRH